MKQITKTKEESVSLSGLEKGSEFSVFESFLKAHVAKMTKDLTALFVVDLDKDKLWETYLNSFPEGTNPIFRKRTEHDCSSCRHFVKAFGNVVSIKNNVVTTVWDFDIPGSKYEPVIKALAAYVRTFHVSDAFITDSRQFGVEKTFEKCESEVITWRHLNVELPSTIKVYARKDLDTIRGRSRDLRNVFKRSIEEISDDSVSSVLELISQNSLYRGEEWKTVLETFRQHQTAYKKLSLTEKENYTWEQSSLAGPVVGKIRNHSIGVLLADLSKGMDLDEAVRRYESIVAPSNYKRPKAIFTAKMLKDAENTITDLGYLSALGRRYAALEDITVNNILFANRDVMSRLGGSKSIFDEMAKETIRPKKFDRVEEVPISVFVSDILPTARNVEVLLENKHGQNLVSLIAPQDKDSKTMFKWDNNFSWAYTGNITDSMKQRVKAAGGDVGGVLRFSIQWNENHDNENDFDAHCIEPTGNEISFRNKRPHRSSGMLDVDIIRPSQQTKDGVAVENITWSDQSKMPEGTYKMFVHNYSHHGGRSGFTAEIEFDGQIHSFVYNKELRQEEKVQVAEVVYRKTSGFSIIEKIPSSMASRKLWGLDTNQFQPVSVIMMSPNYWDEQSGNGNKHFFFMLKNCLNSEQPNGFFNEYLKNELLEHKRVFEALGSKMRVEPSEESQLSGIGFSSTQKNELVVRVEGHVNRMLKILF